jgi:two-component system sensor histidine kinase TctE
LTRRPPSLKSALFGWLALATGLLLAINLAVGVTTSLHFANTAYDSTLFGSAQAMAAGLRTRGESLEVIVPAVSLEMLGGDRGRNVFYRVRAPNGRVLAGFRDIPEPPDRGTRDPFYFDARYRGVSARWIAMHVPVATADAVGLVLIQVGEPAGKRTALSRRIVLTTLLQQLPLALLGGIAVTWGVRRTLRPLVQTGRKIETRSERDLRPIDQETIPAEVRPLIRAINDLLRRTGREVDIQQRFIADASHQLKTPLAILRTNADLALRQSDSREVRRIVARMSLTVAQMSRLTHQLLALLSVEARASMPRAVIDLSDLVARVTADRISSALARDIDLGIEADAPVPMSGDRVLIAEMIGNLLENAVHYTEPGGRVTLRTCLRGEDAVLEVVDNGPGIAREHREMVFERFATVAKNDHGSGLGLAVVKQIVEAHGGDIALGDAPDGRGLLVTVTFRAEPAPPREP